MNNWEKERVYVAKRAEQLKQDMQVAIQMGNDEAFREAYEKSGRYLCKIDRRNIYLQWMKSKGGK